MATNKKRSSNKGVRLTIEATTEIALIHELESIVRAFNKSNHLIYYSGYGGSKDGEVIFDIEKI